MITYLMHMRILELKQNKEVKKKVKGKKNWIEGVLFTFIFLLGIIFTFAIPPFQKPDETAHFLRSVALSDGQFTCNYENGKSYFNVPSKYFSYLSEIGEGRIAFHYEEKFFIEDLKKAESRTYNEEEMVEYGFCFLPFVGYIPASTGILIGDLFNSMSLEIYLARLFNFLVFFILLIWSYKKLKDSKLRWVIISYAMIPMVTHQVSVVGYDAMQLAITPVIFSLIIDFLRRAEIKKKDLLVFVVSMILLLLIKPGYYFLCLLYFLIPWSKIAKEKKKYLLITLIYLLLCVLSVVLYLKLDTSTSFVSTEVNINAHEQLSLLKSPKFFFDLVRNTINTNLVFYIKSFIGVFGWLDYGLFEIIYLLYIFYWAFVAYAIKDDVANIVKKRVPFVTIILGITSFLTIGAVFGGLYLTWNTVGATVIAGVQGRYFLILSPYFVVFISLLIKLFESNKKFRTVIIVLFVVFLLIEILYAIYNRYYYYGYSIDPSIIKNIWENKEFLVSSLQDNLVGIV